MARGSRRQLRQSSDGSKPRLRAAIRRGAELRSPGTAQAKVSSSAERDRRATRDRPRPKATPATTRASTNHRNPEPSSESSRSNARRFKRPGIRRPGATLERSLGITDGRPCCCKPCMGAYDGREASGRLGEGGARARRYVSTTRRNDLRHDSLVRRARHTAERHVAHVALPVRVRMLLPGWSAFAAGAIRV